MRRRRPLSTGNLDSLLDTMTCVVGILVMVMIVTQVGVGDTIVRLGRAREQPDANPEDVEEGNGLLKDGQARLDDLEGRWSDTEPTVKQNEKDLGRLKSENDALEAGLGHEFGSQHEEWTEQEAKFTALNDRLKDHQSEIDVLDGTLSRLPEPPPPASITLPDPKEPREDASKAMFICRYGRITYVDPVVVGKNLKAAIAAWENGSRDWSELRRQVLRKRPGDQNFWMEVELEGDYVFGVLRWRDSGTGESAVQISSKGSDYQKTLSSLNTTKHWIRFLVWSDSFETYLEARRIADRLGFGAGWVAWDVNEESRECLNARPTGGGAKNSDDGVD